VTLQTRATENFRSCRWGDERTVKRAQTVSDDPHRREQTFCSSSRFPGYFSPKRGCARFLQFCMFFLNNEMRKNSHSALIDDWALG
jgi:hypothetical protein